MINGRTVLVVASIVLPAASMAHAAPGDLDPSFGVGGAVTTTFGTPSTDEARALVLQPDGKLVVAGYADRFGASRDFAIVRYEADGHLDPTFDGDGKVTTDVGGSVDGAEALVRQPDGKLVAAGHAYNAAESDLDFAVVRYNPDGSLDATFDGDGKVVTPLGVEDDAALAILVQADGKLVVAGYSFSGNRRTSALVRYNGDGSLDTTFGGDGTVTTATLGAMAALVLQPDGKIVAAGSAPGSTGFGLARYNSDGSFDTTFGADGTVTTPVLGILDSAFALVLQPDGKLVAAGQSHDADGPVVISLVRYHPDGSLDSSFGGDGKVTTAIGILEDFARALVLQPDGRLVVAGSTWENTSDANIALLRYETDGSLDPTFHGDGIVTTDLGALEEALALVLQPDGKLVAAGSSSINGWDFALVRYLGGSVVAGCGDYMVEMGEECDDGNVKGGDCCSATCTIEEAGTTCRTATGVCDVDEVCDGTSGSCPVDGKSSAECRPAVGPCDVAEICDGASNDCPVDAGIDDDDGDGLCNVVDPCTSGAVAMGARVRVSRMRPPCGDERLRFSGVVSLPPSPTIDPLSNGVRIVLVDGSGATIFDEIVPGGAYDPATRTGWRESARSWIYVSHGGRTVITKVSLERMRATPDLYVFKAVSRRGTFVLTPEDLPIRGTFVVDSPTAETGQCGEAVFPGPPDVTCSINASGSILTCR